MRGAGKGTLGRRNCLTEGVETKTKREETNKKVSATGYTSWRQELLVHQSAGARFTQSSRAGLRA